MHHRKWANQILLEITYALKSHVVVKPRLHDTTGCQTPLTTGLTTGCIVYTAICQTGCQTGCTTQFDNRLNEQWLLVQHGCHNRFDNRLDVCLHDAAGCQTGCIV